MPLGEYTCLFSGHPSSDPTRSAHGVAICLNRRAAAAWREAGSVWEAVSERIVYCRLRAHPVNITLVSVYSPINPQPGQTAAEVASDSFYSDLQRTIDKVPSGDMLLILGDLNARVSKRQHHAGSSVVGPHAVDQLNENGQRLTDFCAHNDLIISNTFFKHKRVHQTTWMHPGTKEWHMLDYTLVNRKFRTSVEDVRVLRSCAGVIGTDHHLVRTKVRLHLRTRRKRTLLPRSSRLDKQKLHDPALRQLFQADLIATNARPSTSSSTNEQYHHFVENVNELAQKHFAEDTSARSRKKWLTAEVLDIVDRKAQAFVAWQQHRHSPNARKYHTKYVLLRKLAKKACEERQVEYWDELSIEIEQAIKQNDSSSAYAMLRRLRGGRARIEDMPILDSYGKCLTSSTERLERWKEYFSDLLNVPSTVQPSVLATISSSPISSQEEERQNKPPSLKEIEDAVGRMRCGKAPGIDGITADVLKAGGRSLAEQLHHLFVDIWEDEDPVDDWSTAILIRLFKNKGDKKDCANYRGISLLPVVSKVFSRILLSRVQEHLNSQILDIQAGFRANRTTVDHIITLKMLKEHTRDHNKPLFLCFIDIQKAYDSVDRSLLWQICRHYGMTDKIIRLFKLLYHESKAHVRINGELSDPFDIETGVLQGGIPSCILFNVFFDFIVRKFYERLEVLQITGVKLSYGKDFFHATPTDDEIDLLALLYADDLTLCADNTLDLEMAIQAFEETSQRYGLTMSVKKTCVMPVRQMDVDASRRILEGKEVPPPSFNINIRSERVQTVEEFCYLGYYFTRDFSDSREIDARLAKASKAFNMLRHVIWYRKTVSISARLRIFRSCVLSVLLYGSEVWSLTTALERRLCTFYHRCLRTIIGVNLGDRMSNDQLLHLTGQPSLVDIMRRNRLRWFGHVNRMNNPDGSSSLVKKTMFSFYPESKRPLHSGVRKRWQDTITDDLAQVDIKNWRRQTMDRKNWRASINKKTQVQPPAANLAEIVKQFKQRADDRRATAALPPPPRVVELLRKNTDRTYTCPRCNVGFMPQGITKHVKSCAKQWCKLNRISTT